MTSTSAQPGCSTTSAWPVYRLIVEPHATDGIWNMAVDETLLESSVSCGVCTLRWYRWSEATLSVGYFQSRSETGIPSNLSELPWVRRLSGGGAIVHHHELTYSLAMPRSHPLAIEPTRLYELVHQQIVTVLKRYKVGCRIRGDHPAPPLETYLCFGRSDPNDIICKGHKIVGSAQRRRRGSILQHGSLILSRSLFAPEFPGIVDLVGFQACNTESLQRELTEAIGSLLGRESEISELSADERDQAQQLAISRYGTRTWDLGKMGPGRKSLSVLR